MLHGWTDIVKNHELFFLWFNWLNMASMFKSSLLRWRHDETIVMDISFRFLWSLYVALGVRPIKVLEQ